MATKHTDQIHELTSAEINRKIRAIHESYTQDREERAALYAHALKTGNSGETPIIDADERAAREHAKTWLNGSAPASLDLPPEITRDRFLLRSMRGKEIALKILSDTSLVARAAEAVAWAEASSGPWRALCREITLTAIRLEALEQSARQLLDGCPDLTAVRLPMVVVANSRSISEIPLRDLTETALAEGVITNADIRKAQNVS